jgi:hypothetical protein
MVLRRARDPPRGPAGTGRDGADSGHPGVLTGKSRRRVVVATPAEEGGRGAALSPDGRWLAYTSNETGSLEIWVRPFPGPGAPVRVSLNGGVEPVWARHRRELYYLEQNRAMAVEQNRMMVVAIDPDPEFSFTPATLLSESRYRHGGPQSHDVAADGRFVIIKLAEELETDSPPLQVVINWTSGF